MTILHFVAGAGLAALAFVLPGVAAAQDQWCLDFVDSYCGGSPVNECFVPDMMQYDVPAECMGDVQMLYEMANEYDAQVSQDQAYQDEAYNPAYDNCDPSYGAACDPPDAMSGAQSAAGGFDTGYSYGGNLRDGPSDGYAVVGSLPEGSWISMEASGTWSGGYQWFYIQSDYGAAYHWGGLMCSMDYYVDGVLSVC